ncbi:MAG: aminopeptidase P family protein, partial [Blautia sp.]|nr:aminopeptidase P family protein [Blautia sp.]
YDDIYEFVKSFSAKERVYISRDQLNYRIVNSIPQEATLVYGPNFTLYPKAVKTSVEVKNEKTAHIKDAVALTKFIYWLKTNAASEKISELSAAEKLYELRSQQEHFMGESFDPIIAYGEHAAIIHYSATPETNVTIQPKGLLLADTGGQYMEGTTDVTRTIVVGPVTDKEKKYFTAVLKGTLRLAAAKFKYGTCGLNLDYLARQALWEIGADYNHGTGHGVGYFLNVHEGPNSFHWKITPTRRGDTVFEEGMITSDEPGYYEAGAFGIRHENLLVCRKAEQTEYGQFLCFEHLTLVPFDIEGIVVEDMSDSDLKLLNEYHRKVYSSISAYLTEEERKWLQDVTKPIRKL